MAEIPKLDLKSKNIAADKQAQLKALFPEVFTEGDKIDFDKLRLTLGDSVDTNDERFGLHWAGKKECFSIIQEPSIGTLKPAKEESVNWEDTENLFIEGDNLEVLKLLQKSYYGKVKMIYIDPPYNTGREFIYPDKYQENIETYLAYTGQVDDDGYKFSTNAETEGRFHSNWLNMMYPRLFLARNLLKDDGIIFISINDNEVDNLRKVCNEIFGEENFINAIVVNMNSLSGVKMTHAIKGKRFPAQKEYLLLYKKGGKTPVLSIPKKSKDEWDKEYNMIIPELSKTQFDDFNLMSDEDVNSLLSEMSLLSLNEYGTENNIELTDEWKWENSYRIFGTKSNTSLAKKVSAKSFSQIIVCYTNSEGNKRYFKSDFNRAVKDPRIELVQAYSNSTVFISDNWIDISNDGGVAQEGGIIFPNGKKPLALMKRIIETTNSTESIILDFFSGSCSTAHAVIDTNLNKRSNLKYIMVQLPEPIDKKDELYKTGFKNVADIGKERIRRVIKRIEEKKQSLEAELQAQETALAELEAQKAKTPKLFENGKSKDLAELEANIEGLKGQIANIESTDLGFKVFKLDKSNFKVWDGSVENDVPKQIEMAINHLEPDSKEFDILFEILLKAGFELTLPIRELTLADKKVYSVEDDALLICLENELNEDVIRAIAAKEPARFVCLDTGFKDNDQLKTNAVQIMKSHNVHDFKTV